MWDLFIAPHVRFISPTGETFTARAIADAFGDFPAFDDTMHTVKCNLADVVLSWRVCIHGFPTMKQTICQHELAATCGECDQPIRWNMTTRQWVNIYGYHTSENCSGHKL